MRDELVAEFTANYQQIYGDDINLSSDTPDGQMMNIYIQAILDLEDLLVQVYNSFDPDNAVGVVLDQRLAINGIQRQAGTYTLTNVTVVTSQSLNLYGLDQTANDIYTVADNAGNQWQLVATQLGLAAGTHILAFRAAKPGAQLTIPNTITVPVSIVLGVTSVNNPTTYTSLGTNEEPDVVAKVRRQKSVSLASQGYLPGLLAALENVAGVTSAFVYENTTGATDSNGVPAHSIWAIVAGSFAAADVAAAIYRKRNAGCGMYGATTYTITQVDGTPFIVAWDTVLQRNIFIAFTATSINGTTAPNIAAIRAGIAARLTLGVNETVNINEVGTIAQEIDPNCLVTGCGITTGQTQVLTLSGVAASGTFLINYNGGVSAVINWNDSAATVQSKVQAIPGLSAAVLTGSIASQSLSFDLSAVPNVQGLLYVSANSLQTSAPAAITFSYNEGYQNVLTPNSKKVQLAVSAANIVITAMQVSPTSATVTHGSSQIFQGIGGYGAYTYTLSVNNSGATIDAASGLYTAGTTVGVTDTVKVTDAFGNTATAAVSVV